MSFVSNKRRAALFWEYGVYRRGGLCQLFSHLLLLVVVLRNSFCAQQKAPKKNQWMIRNYHITTVVWKVAAKVSIAVFSEPDGRFPVFTNSLLGRDDAPLPSPVFLEAALNFQSQKRVGKRSRNVPSRVEAASKKANHALRHIQETQAKHAEKTHFLLEVYIDLDGSLGNILHT